MLSDTPTTAPFSLSKNALTILIFPANGKHFRAFTNEEGEPLFIGAETGRAIGHTHLYAVRDHVEDDEKQAVSALRILNVQDKPTQITSWTINTSVLDGLDPHTIIINKYGLYSLIIASHTQVAKDFKKWIESVFVSIHRTVRYELEAANASLREQLTIATTQPPFHGRVYEYRERTTNRLLYIGSCSHPQLRISEHESSANKLRKDDRYSELEKWMAIHPNEYDVHIRPEPFACHDDMLDAERRAIMTGNPTFSHVFYCDAPCLKSFKSRSMRSKHRTQCTVAGVASATEVIVAPPANELTPSRKRARSTVPAENRDNTVGESVDKMFYCDAPCLRQFKSRTACDKHRLRCKVNTNAKEDEIVVQSFLDSMDDATIVDICAARTMYTVLHLWLESHADMQHLHYPKYATVKDRFANVLRQARQRVRPPIPRTIPTL